MREPPGRRRVKGLIFYRQGRTMIDEQLHQIRVAFPARPVQSCAAVLAASIHGNARRKQGMHRGSTVIGCELRQQPPASGKQGRVRRVRKYSSELRGSGDYTIPDKSIKRRYVRICASRFQELCGLGLATLYGQRVCCSTVTSEGIDGSTGVQ